MTDLTNRPTPPLTVEGVSSAIARLQDEPVEAYQRFCYWVLVGGPDLARYLPITCEVHGHIGRPALRTLMKLYRWHERFGRSEYAAVMYGMRDQIDKHLDAHLPAQLRGMIAQALCNLQVFVDAEGPLSPRDTKALADIWRTVLEGDRIRQGLPSDPGMPGRVVDTDKEQYELLTPKERYALRRLKAKMRGEQMVIDLPPSVVVDADTEVKDDKKTENTDGDS